MLCLIPHRFLHELKKNVSCSHVGILYDFIVSEAKIMKGSNYPKLDVTVAVESKCF
jgi:hypothetical protein